MKAIKRMGVVFLLACGAIVGLWLVFDTAAASPSQPARLPALPGPAGDNLSVTMPVSAYMPLIAHDVSITYAFALPSNLSAVERLYPLTDSARARLRRQGFVILGDEMESKLSFAYAPLAFQSSVPVLVTSDAMLYLFHIVLDDLLMTVEKETLYTDTLSLVRALQADSLAVYSSVPVTEPLIREAAAHNVVAIAVARALLEPDFVPPAEVVTQVLVYTAKVEAHTAVELYPGDDYTQYEPRGHYAGDAQLERYFRAMKWLGRRIYRIQDDISPHDADVELVAATLLARMLDEDGVARSAWQRLYEVTRLLCGPADSITPPLVSLAVSRTFGLSFTVAMLEEGDNLALLREELLTGDDYPTSEIIPVPTLPGQMPKRYIQIMGERYLPDGEVMQETTSPHTARMLPSGLDVMAALLGSEQADTLLGGEKVRYPDLAGQLDALRAQFGAYTTTWWTRSTYNSWLYSLQPLLGSFDTAYPRFMQNEEWERKELNTALASWAHLRHDFILYGKQTYPSFGMPQAHGLIEPVPGLYARLGDACRQISGTLAAFDALPDAHAWALANLAASLDDFAGYAAMTLAGQPLDEETQAKLGRFGLWLMSFFGPRSVEEKTPATVADVATDASTTRVLHEGVGLFNPVVVLIDPPGGAPITGTGEVTAALGYVLSYYEFALPGFERLTDAEWQTQVISGTPPARPWWMADVLHGDLFEDVRSTR